jgi:hypothetical protein
VNQNDITDYERLRRDLDYSPEEMAEALGKVVRESWVFWASSQPDAKAHWLVPWEELDEKMREVDRRIGVDVVRFWEGLKMKARLKEIEKRLSTPTSQA